MDPNSSFTSFYPTYDTEPDPGIPIKLISNLVNNRYLDKMQYWNRNEMEGNAIKLLCDNVDVSVTPFENLGKEGSVQILYDGTFTEDNIELNLQDCGGVVSKLFIAKPITKTVDFISICRKENECPPAVSPSKLIADANKALNRVGINLVLGKNIYQSKIDLSSSHIITMFNA